MKTVWVFMAITRSFELLQVKPKPSVFLPATSTRCEDCYGYGQWWVISPADKIKCERCDGLGWCRAPVVLKYRTMKKDKEVYSYEVFDPAQVRTDGRRLFIQREGAD
jgi:hypothetical protein